MIGNITIENFKSITNLDLPLGRVNVLAGDNGCGKSNILEAVVLCGAAAADKLDNEYFEPRGLRVPDDVRLLTAAFPDQDENGEIHIKATWRLDELGYGVESFECRLTPDDSTPYLSLVNKGHRFYVAEGLKYIGKGKFRKTGITTLSTVVEHEIVAKEVVDSATPETVARHMSTQRLLQKFVVYSPDYGALRDFKDLGQILPLGISGAGLFKLLTILSSSDNSGQFAELKDQLRLIDWFQDFDFSPEAAFGDRSLRIKDRYLFLPALPDMSQRSANKGFLFLLFYFSLFISDLTPKFFAIDNIHA